MPKEMAGAANLMAHPLAGAAALSALGVGLASQAFGAWMGALAGAAEISQKLFQPVDAAQADDDAFTEHPRHSAIRDEAAARQALIDKTKTLAARKARASSARAPRTAAAADGKVQATRAQGAAVAEIAAAPVAAVPLAAGNGRQPKTLARPAAPDNLKAIAGIGPKLEQVLNGFGIWTYDQISAWTAEEIVWMENHLGLVGRIGRDGWQEQAATLAVRTGTAG
jgi:NADH-quinone oxidoreductase subunit E